MIHMQFGEFFHHILVVELGEVLVVIEVESAGLAELAEAAAAIAILRP